MLVVHLVSGMLLDQLSHSVAIEQTARESLLREQSLAQERLHRAPEPVANRNPESHLTPVKVFCRHKFLQHALE